MILFNTNGIWFYLFIVNAFVSIVLIILERKKPEKTIAWLLVFVLLPPLGLLFYIFLGRNWKKHKLSKSSPNEAKDSIDNNSIESEYKEYSSLTTLLAENSSSPVYKKNDIKIFNNGKDKFDALKDAILKAEKHIHLEYYIVKSDKIGTEIISLLIQKAREGVRIKFIIDKVGSIKLKRKYIQCMREAGVDVVYYSYFLAPLLRTINTQINYRNHRKIAVIDGKVGFVGGINIGDEYLGNSKLGFWRDTHIMVKGEFVKGLQQVFLDDFSTIKRINEERFFCGSEPNEFFPKIDGEGNSVMQCVKSGPNSEHSSIMQGMLKMISSAKEYIHITTPYFIPTEGIMDALKVAALSGIKVRILFPGKCDHITVYYASRTYLAELLKCGVELYTYKKDAFIHSKVISIDGKISTVGTANMDIRSFELNYEINAFIYDENVTHELDNLFYEDLSQSTKNTQEDYDKASKLTKSLEALARVFSSLL